MSVHLKEGSVPGARQAACMVHTQCWRDWEQYAGEHDHSRDCVMLHLIEGAQAMKCKLSRVLVLLFFKGFPLEGLET